jgi:hypothetical protein
LSVPAPLLSAAVVAPFELVPATVAPPSPGNSTITTTASNGWPTDQIEAPPADLAGVGQVLTTPVSPSSAAQAVPAAWQAAAPSSAEKVSDALFLSTAIDPLLTGSEAQASHKTPPASPENPPPAPAIGGGQAWVSPAAGSAGGPGGSPVAPGGSSNTAMAQTVASAGLTTFFAGTPVGGAAAPLGAASVVASNGSPAPAQSAPATVPASSLALPGVSLGQAPAIRFEANAGQVSGAADFVARGQGYAMRLSSTGALLGLYQPGRVTVLGLSLVGSNPAAQPAGVDELSGRSNYLIGSDASAWRTGIANFGRVVYQGVYPGIDLHYYGTGQGQLEYTFAVQPGADPGAIRLQMQGVGGLSLDGQGNLVLHGPAGELTQHAPLVYQMQGGTRQDVGGRFVLSGGNQVGFAVGSYDPTRPLYLDPVSYSSYLGGAGSDSGNAVAVDGNGNAYFTGSTASLNFPTTPGTYQTGSGGGTDVFVTVLPPVKDVRL